MRYFIAGLIVGAALMLGRAHAQDVFIAYGVFSGAPKAWSVNNSGYVQMIGN